MAMTDIQADRLFDSMLRKLENRLSRKILANFNKLSRLIREVIANDGVFAGNVIIIENQRELELILIQAYEESIRQGLRFTRRDLEMPPPEEDDFNDILLLLLLWRTDTAAVHAAQLTQTTIDIFNRAVEDAEEAGLTGSALDKSVARTMARHNRRRVPTIATTEAGEAMSKGSEATALEVGRIMLKKWRSQGDSIVRPTHRTANSAAAIPLDQDFAVGASHGAFPRDSKLSMAERINCRCFVRYKLQKLEE